MFRAPGRRSFMAGMKKQGVELVPQVAPDEQFGQLLNLVSRQASDAARPRRHPRRELQLMPSGMGKACNNAMRGERKWAATDGAWRSLAQVFHF